MRGEIAKGEGGSRKAREGREENYTGMLKSTMVVVETTRVSL